MKVHKKKQAPSTQRNLKFLPFYLEKTLCLVKACIGSLLGKALPTSGRDKSVPSGKEPKLEIVGTAQSKSHQSQQESSC